jgi:hypothetical protein
VNQFQLNTTNVCQWVDSVNNCMISDDFFAHACAGDSGSPWMLQRDGQYLVFAHTIPCGVTIARYLPWVFDASRQIDPAHALVLQDATTSY